MPRRVLRKANGNSCRRAEKARSRRWGEILQDIEMYRYFDISGVARSLLIGTQPDCVPKGLPCRASRPKQRPPYPIRTRRRGPRGRLPTNRRPTTSSRAWSTTTPPPTPTTRRTRRSSHPRRKTGLTIRHPPTARGTTSHRRTSPPTTIRTIRPPIIADRLPTATRAAARPTRRRVPGANPPVRTTTPQIRAQARHPATPQRRIPAMVRPRRRRMEPAPPLRQARSRSLFPSWWR